jgi:L-lactate dehydrogenase
MLDTARLRQRLGVELDVDPRSVHAQVVGEHGDSEVVLWSGARVGGVPLEEWPGWSSGLQQQVTDQVRTAAYEIIRRKGATNHAIGLVTAALLRWSRRGAGRVLTVSRVQDGALGLQGVALSLPSVVSSDGVVRVLEPQMTMGEREALARSAAVLEAAWAEVGEAEPGR